TPFRPRLSDRVAAASRKAVGAGQAPGLARPTSSRAGGDSRRASCREAPGPLAPGFLPLRRRRPGRDRGPLVAPARRHEAETLNAAASRLARFPRGPPGRDLQTARALPRPRPDLRRRRGRGALLAGPLREDVLEVAGH